MLAPLLAIALAAAPRIAVMPITPGAAVAAPEAAAMTEVLVSEIRRRSRAEVITQREISSILTMEQQKRMLGCGSDACMAELGGALGVERLVTGDVAKLGESLLLHLRLVDVAKVRVVAQSDRRLKRGSYDDLLDVLPIMAAELFQEPVAAGKPTPPPTASAPATTPKPPAQPAPAAVQTSAAVVRAVDFKLPDGMVAVHVRGGKDIGLIAWSEEAGSRRYVTATSWYDDPAGSTDFGPYWLLNAAEFRTGKMSFGFVRVSWLGWGATPWSVIGRGACGSAEWSLAESRQVWIDPRDCKPRRSLEEALRAGK